ncbi:hypothetical protein GMJAKD_02955 [Candidatus Electrothrix aarhusensis]
MDADPVPAAERPVGKDSAGAAQRRRASLPSWRTSNMLISGQGLESEGVQALLKAIK